MEISWSLGNCERKEKGGEDRRAHRCFDCKKPWKPGHKCDKKDESKPENNNLALSDNDGPNLEGTADPDLSMGSQIADYMFGKPEVNITERDYQSKRIFHTPVTIDGIAARALVDGGGTDMFNSKRFVESEKLEVIETTGEITGGGGKKLADRIGYVKVEVQFWKAHNYVSHKD